METCKNCGWWVNEGDTIGVYSHEDAIKQQKGFCLREDLFTYTDKDSHCNDFVQSVKDNE